MRKYTKKEQRFISNHYQYDLERLIACIENVRGEHKKKLSQVVIFARELISADTSSTEQMFEISESVEEELLEVWNVLCELSNEDKLPENNQTYFEEITELQDQLRILNNLHPDKILTWEDVR